MKQLSLTKNQVLFKENETVDGIYIILEGQLKYSKNVNYQVPIEAKTKNKWFKQQVVKNGITNTVGIRDMAVFSS